MKGMGESSNESIYRHHISELSKISGTLAAGAVYSMALMIQSLRFGTAEITAGYWTLAVWYGILTVAVAMRRKAYESLLK